ncbi:MAG: AmmeMemoRadiSam system protein A, partial [Candidatus Aenigmatarchaeota archaeon]
KAIEVYLREKRVMEIPEDIPLELKKRGGSFVSIHTKTGKLRGCIGIPYPIHSLIDAIFIAAREACSDPRFEPIKKDELEKIVIEVSILSFPEEIKTKKSEEYLEKIERYKDGIIIKYGLASALFLPQVWEKISNKEEFLANLCLKAGLPPNCWKHPNVKLFKFSAQIFKEEKPYGNIIEVRL